MEQSSRRRGGARPGAGRKKGSPGTPGAGKKKGSPGNPGSGRKPTGRMKHFVSTSVSGTAEEIAALKAAAAAAGKSVSRYVLDPLHP